MTFDKVCNYKVDLGNVRLFSKFYPFRLVGVREKRAKDAAADDGLGVKKGAKEPKAKKSKK